MIEMVFIFMILKYFTFCTMALMVDRNSPIYASTKSFFSQTKKIVSTNLNELIV